MTFIPKVIHQFVFVILIFFILLVFNKVGFVMHLSGN